MAEFTVKLLHGISIGGAREMEAVLRDATVEDIIAASEESEQVVMVAVGIDDDGRTQREPQLVISPTRCGVNTLRRQIVSIGKLDGPFTREMMAKIHPHDFNLLQAEIGKREQAALKAVAQRGRDDANGGDADDSN